MGKTLFGTMLTAEASWPLNWTENITPFSWKEIHFENVKILRTQLGGRVLHLARGVKCLLHFFQVCQCEHISRTRALRNSLPPGNTTSNCGPISFLCIWSAIDHLDWSRQLNSACLHEVGPLVYRGVCVFAQYFTVPVICGGRSDLLTLSLSPSQSGGKMWLSGLRNAPPSDGHV